MTGSGSGAPARVTDDATAAGGGNRIVSAESCPVCSFGNWSVDSLATRILGVPSTFAVMECRHCGQRKLQPYLSEAELHRLYGPAYFGDEAAESGLEGIAVADASYVEQCVPARLEKFRHTIRRLRAMNPAAKTILDYGAATGNFVAIAHEEGLVAEGVELSAEAVRIAAKRYGVDLIQGGIEAIPDRRYDLIHLHHVFEHLTNPASDLHALVRHLEPGGTLFIEIPYQFHIVERLRFRMKRTAWSAKPTLLSFHHPYFYTPNSLRTMLERTGLHVLSLRTFVPAHYAATSLPRAIKKLGWWALDRVFALGNIIEAVARVRAT